jgi:Thioredoxin
VALRFAHGWIVSHRRLRDVHLGRGEPVRVAARVLTDASIYKVARFRSAGRSGKPRGLPLPQLSFQVANRLLVCVCVCVDQRRISEQADVHHPPHLSALSVTGLAAFAGFSPLRLIADAMAQSASDIAKPVSLPEMALGPANASVRITEYASMTCSHCAAFNANVFPKIKSEYIDTGKVRYVFREFPLDIRPQWRRCWRAASPRTMPANILP